MFLFRSPRTIKVSVCLLHIHTYIIFIANLFLLLVCYCFCLSPPSPKIGQAQFQKQKMQHTRCTQPIYKPVEPIWKTCVGRIFVCLLHISACAKLAQSMSRGSTGSSSGSACVFSSLLSLLSFVFESCSTASASV